MEKSISQVYELIPKTYPEKEISSALIRFNFDINETVDYLLENQKGG